MRSPLDFPVLHSLAQCNLSSAPFVEIEGAPTEPFPENKVISLFSGAGGLDLGLESAGFETAVAVEWDADCRATLAYNRPQWNPALSDIRPLSSNDILRAAGLERGEAALVVGGPPCQPFSNMGKKEGVEDERNGDLFQHYARVVKETEPQAFLFENVEGFAQPRHRAALNHLLGELGPRYAVAGAVLNAADYGVPQTRKRFILIGVRSVPRAFGKPLSPALPFPTHFPSRQAQVELRRRMGLREERLFKSWATVREALDSIPAAIADRSDFILMNTADFVRERMALLRPGENFKALPMQMRPKCWQDGRHQGQDTFGRLRPDRPSVTIRTAAYNPSKGMYIHPDENRGLSSHEMAALQSFPPEWEFRCEGRRRVTLVSVGKQIGNAVPPLLGRAVGLALRRSLRVSGGAD